MSVFSRIVRLCLKVEITFPAFLLCSGPQAVKILAWSTHDILLLLLRAPKGAESQALPLLTHASVTVAVRCKQQQSRQSVLAITSLLSHRLLRAAAVIITPFIFHQKDNPHIWIHAAT